MPVLPYRYAAVLSVEQVREVDRRAIEQVQMPGMVLMENASRAVAEVVYHALIDPQRERVLVLCGPGNNGGDGLAAARHLHNAGVQVACALATTADRLRGDAGLNLRIFRHTQRPLIEAINDEGLNQARKLASQATVIVDALLGTGSSGPPRGTIAGLIRLANEQARARRIAVDVPSGLDAQTGTVHEPCFRADATVTFVAAKAGFGAERALEVLGRVIVADIGVPVNLLQIGSGE